MVFFVRLILEGQVFVQCPVWCEAGAVSRWLCSGYAAHKL